METATEEELKPDVVELEDGTFQANCPSCHQWKSEPKADSLSATRALSGHLKSCSGKASPSESVAEPEGTPTEEGKREELIFVSHDEQLFNQVKSDLKKLLPQVSGIGGDPKSKTVESVLLTLTVENTARPEILISHIQSCAKQANPYVTALVVNGIYSRLGQAGLYAGSLAPIGLYAGAPGYGSQGEVQPSRRYSNEYSEGEGDREELKELRAELKEVREKLQATQLQGLQDQINDLKRTPSFVDQYESFLAASERLGLSQNKGGKTTVDLISDGMEKADKRASEAIDLLKRPQGQFNPEVKRTPQERQEAAANIQEQLARKERILQAENELLIAAAEG